MFDIEEASWFENCNVLKYLLLRKTPWFEQMIVYVYIFVIEKISWLEEVIGIYVGY